MQCLKALGYISFWLQLPETVLIFLQVRRENSEKWFKVPHSPLRSTAGSVLLVVRSTSRPIYTTIVVLRLLYI